MKNFSSTPLLHSLGNIEIIKYLYYEPRFNGAYSRDNLPRVKGGAYFINLDNNESKRTLMIPFRGRYSASERLVKLTRFQCFSLQLSGYQDITPLSFVLRQQL